MENGREVNEMKKAQIVIIGAGPAGLCAAIEAARAGAKVVIIEENHRAGGQLFKQIHKFFGSKEHQAGKRGFQIGEALLEEVGQLGVEVWLGTEVCGINPQLVLWVVKNKKEHISLQADKVILAAGAIENPLAFPGWTLPGVMGAGAAQTMANVYRVLPGKRILIIGSGNVGVIVAYQLMQAGAQIQGVVEGKKQLGAYGVHTAKLSRAGVPFYTRSTISRAIGEEMVEAAEIVEIDDDWNHIPGTEVQIPADTICLAAGFTPLTELAWTAGCRFAYIPEAGGHIPVHNEKMETTQRGIYVAGDITGIEEASTAMEEGRLAGIQAAAALELYTEEEAAKMSEGIWKRLHQLRSGPLDGSRKAAKEKMLRISKEGYDG